MNLLTSLLACSMESQFTEIFDPVPPMSADMLVSVCEPPVDEATPLDLSHAPADLDAHDREIQQSTHDQWIQDVETQLPAGADYQDLLDGRLSFHIEAIREEDEIELKFNAGGVPGQYSGLIQTTQSFGCRVRTLQEEGVETEVSIAQLISTEQFLWERHKAESLAIDTMIRECTQNLNPDEAEFYCESSRYQAHAEDWGISFFLNDESDIVSCDPSEEPCHLLSVRMGPTSDELSVGGKILSVVNRLNQHVGVMKYFYQR